MIQPFWTDQYCYFDYYRRPFNNNNDEARWRSQGFSQEFFTGEMYDNENPMPKWTDNFYSIFTGKNFGLTFYKMHTCNILPYHSDTYVTYKKIYKIKNSKNIWRAIFFLEDWKPGHIFEIDYTPITSWRAGQFVLWQNDTPHMAANLGNSPRYTAQLTFTNV